MTARNRNELWGRVLLDELARSGVRDIVVSPGSRSTPLVLAAASDRNFRITVQVDERSAGFIALGVGKATGRPAAVITTSGTAVTNLFPAVVEASGSEVPLLLLTADRPPRLRGADANQTIDQVKVFGEYPRFFAELSPAEVSEETLRHLRSTASRSVSAAMGDPPGPVHLNLAFDKPLEPIPVEGDLPIEFANGRTPGSGGRFDGVPWTRSFPRRPGPSSEMVAELKKALSASSRPLIVAGVLPRPWEAGPVLRRAASALGIPLLADVLSGARFPAPDEAADAMNARAPVVGGYDIALRDRRVRDGLTPDLIIRAGSAPTSSVLNDWLIGLEGVTHLLLDAGGRWKDHTAGATCLIPCDPLALLQDVLTEPPNSGGWAPDWIEAWSAVEEAVHHGLARDHGGPPSEGRLIARLVELTDSEDLLFVSNSMPVRDLDAFVPSRRDPLLVLGNRGASGIDGIVSTAAGASLGTGRRVVAVLGDLAFIHDTNGLATLRHPDVNVLLVVIHNDGGGIFDFLPVRNHEPAFTPFIATPHGRDLVHLANFHELAYTRVDARGAIDRTAEVRKVSESVLSSGGSGILEIRTDREENRCHRIQAVDEIARVAGAALES